MPKLLLVEDDALMVRMYSRKFEADGFELATALDGEAGLAAMRADKPDLVLLDIMMPKKNGLEVLDEMKSDALLKDLPVILLTNMGSSQEDIDRGLEKGAVAYLIKSDNKPDEVVKKVKEVLKGYTHDKDVPSVSA